MSWGEAERERQNSNQAPSSELSAQSLMQGSNPQTHRPRDHDLSQSQTLNRPSHPGVPWELFVLLLQMSVNLKLFQNKMFKKESIPVTFIMSDLLLEG